MKNLLIGICLLAFLHSLAWACPVPCTDCTLPKGQVVQPYKVTLYDTLGQYSSITGVTGDVPPGLSLTIDQNVTGYSNRPHSLVLVGTPTQPGIYTFNYKFEDAEVWQPIRYIPGYGNYLTQRIEIACVSVSKAWSSGSVTMVPIDLDDIFVVIPVEKNLPRDPGSAGDATLAGIDSNGNGLRDEIEREIVYAYPSNPKAQTALFEMANYYQFALANNGSATAVQQSFAIISAWGTCLEAATGDGDVEGRLLRPMVLNTYDRSLAYIAALRSVQGSVLTPTPPITCP